MIFPWSACKPFEILDMRFINDSFDWWMSLFQTKYIDLSVAKTDIELLSLSPRCTQFLMQNLTFSDVFSLSSKFAQKTWRKTTEKKVFGISSTTYIIRLCVSREKGYMLTFCLVRMLMVAIGISDDLTKISAHRVLSLIFRYFNNQCRLEHDGHDSATSIPSSNT